MDIGIPFNPLRTDLYTAEELYNTFAVADPESFARCNDVAIYRRFRLFGANPVHKDSESTLHALHDNSISRLVDAHVHAHSRVVAIMGGHKMSRGHGEYERVVGLARGLSQDGVLLASGGGPGAMEATHLGALLRDATTEEVRIAIDELGSEPNIPSDAAHLVRKDGTIDIEIARKLHAYLAPAIRITERYRRAEAGPSIAVPTWLYGHEPTTPFARHIAKYFQNSLREDGLVTLAVTGIIFTEGKAGTIQEIFQDAAQNYYQSTGAFCKMVFLSSPGSAYWEKQYPVRPLIEALLGHLPEAKNKILFTEDAQHACSFAAQ